MPRSTRPTTYHHGNLRRAVLDALEEAVLEAGPAAVTLRSLARRVGVAHTAPLHYFGSLTKIFTAFAAEGFTELTARLRRARETGDDALEIGISYVAFAQDRPAHFEVMYTPGLLDDHDHHLEAARQDAMAELRYAIDTVDDPGARADMAAAVVAGWSLMHGLAVLAASGSLDAAHVRDLTGAGDDLLALARRAGGMLYGSPSH